MGFVDYLIDKIALPANLTCDGCGAHMTSLRSRCVATRLWTGDNLVLLLSLVSQGIFEGVIFGCLIIVSSIAVGDAVHGVSISDRL